MTKVKMIDLFAGCGGLTEGFLQTGLYDEIAAIEWLKPQVDTLRNRLLHKWKIQHSSESVMRFDIQREDELFSGWNCLENEVQDHEVQPRTDHPRVYQCIGESASCAHQPEFLHI